jgi:peptidoglycan/xylan/chitin deacetylase (PgdA/CDA1 family)
MNASSHTTRRSIPAVAVVLVSLLVAAGCAGSRPAAHGPAVSPSASDRTPTASPSPSRDPKPAPSSFPHVNRPPTSPPPLPVTQPPASSPGLPGSLVGSQWYELPTTKKVVALTFDAGANADAVPSILQTLADTGVPATFFLTGKWVEVYPEYASRIGALYPVGNHSYSHPDLTTLTDTEVRDEIEKGAAAIRSASGRDTHPLFRFPFGASDSRTLDVVNGLGFGAINWTVDTRGWQGTSGGQTADAIVQRVIDALRPGAIVIMHVGSNPNDRSTLDADALPRVIQEIAARGYAFVSVDQYL